MQVMLEVTVVTQMLHLAQVTNNFRNHLGSFFSEKSSIIFIVGKSPMDIVNRDTHKEIIAQLDYDTPPCPDCGSQMKKYDFQKPSKITYLETTGMPTRILLKKRRFKCYQCSKMMVAETSLVKKNHQIPRIINQKIAQKLIEKTSMTDIAHQLSISTSTVIRKLNDFHFEHNFSHLPKIMTWDVETVRGVTVSIER